MQEQSVEQDSFVEESPVEDSNVDVPVEESTVVESSVEESDIIEESLEVESSTEDLTEESTTEEDTELSEILTVLVDSSASASSSNELNSEILKQCYTEIQTTNSLLVRVNQQNDILLAVIVMLAFVGVCYNILKGFTRF